MFSSCMIFRGVASLVVAPRSYASAKSGYMTEAYRDWKPLPAHRITGVEKADRFTVTTDRGAFTAASRTACSAFSEAAGFSPFEAG